MKCVQYFSDYVEILIAIIFKMSQDQLSVKDLLKTCCGLISLSVN